MEASMSNAKKGVIGILTGGGDVPGLNPAIRAVTIRARREGYDVIGIRRGWAGLIDIIPDEKADNSNNFQVLTEEIVNRAGRTGGTFLHTSRTNPSKVKRDRLPPHLQEKYSGSFPAFHLILQPMLGSWFAEAGLPASTASIAARKSVPVTGTPFPGRLSSNWPR